MKKLIPVLKQKLAHFTVARRGKNLSAAEMLAKGNECKKKEEYIMAEAWYIKAAEKGNTEAMIKIAYGYIDAKFTAGTPDYAKGEEWLRKAAELGDDTAMIAMGRHYQNGDFNGGTNDYNTAEIWYFKAMERNRDLIPGNIMGYGTFLEHTHYSG